MMAIPYHHTVTAYDAFLSQRMAEQFAFILQTYIYQNRKRLRSIGLTQNAQEFAQRKPGYWTLQRSFPLLRNLNPHPQLVFVQADPGNRGDTAPRIDPPTQPLQVYKALAHGGRYTRLALAHQAPAVAIAPGRIEYIG